MKVVILGASPTPSRYAHKALEMLKEYNHEVALVNPLYPEIEGKTCYPDLKGFKKQEVDTVTLYVTPKHLKPHMKDLIDLSPRRVISNPGTYDPELMKELQDKGIQVEEACTLVMLRTGQF